MNKIAVRCLECKEEIKTKLNRSEEGIQYVTCECGVIYKVTNYKDWSINITRVYR